MSSVSIGILLCHDRAYGRDKLVLHGILLFCFSDHVYALFFWEVSSVSRCIFMRSLSRGILLRHHGSVDGDSL